jgi:hypothetical protein
MTQEVTGTSPNGQSERIVELQLQGSTVSIWLHSPGAQGGWQALVSLDEFRAALRREGIAD